MEKRQLLADSLKSTVIPVHKGGDRYNYDSYGPASLTFIMLKTLERGLREVIANHMEANQLMVVKQHGYWHKSSCLTNSISLLDEVTGITDGDKRIDACHPDFQEAFKPKLLDQIRRLLE